jgi:HlyD family secretion protein
LAGVTPGGAGNSIGDRQEHAMDIQNGRVGTNRDQAAARAARRGLVLKRSLGALGAGALLLVAGTAMVAANRQPASRDAASPATLDVATATVMAFDITATAVGELEARRQIEIRNQLEQPTTIVEIVREGQSVKSGDVLVRLNSDSLQQQIEEETLRRATAQADLSVAQNAYEIQVNENDSALRKAQLNVELKELELRKWMEGEVASERQKLDLALDRAKRELERLSEKYKRSVELESRGFLSRDELRRDELAYLEAQAALQTAELNRRVYEEFEFPKDQKTRLSDVEEAKAELERVIRKNESQLASRDADRSNKAKQLEIRSSKLQRLTEQLEAATIRAPSDGLVVHATSLNRDRWGGSDRGTMEVGRQVSRNELMIVLPDTSEMVAAVRVHESLAGRVRPGQPANVRIDAFGGKTVRAQVLSIGVLAESGGWRDPNLREYTVRIALGSDSDLAALKPSMRCEAEIFLDRVERALAVPIQAVFADGLVRFVYVPNNDGTYSKKPVRVGRRSDRFAEIAAGLADGDRVLVRQPAPAEVRDEPWDADELAAVGLKLNPDGSVAGAGRGAGGPPGGPPGGMPGGMPAGMPAGAGGGRPGGAPGVGQPAAPAGAPAEAPPAAQPASPAPVGTAERPGRGTPGQRPAAAPSPNGNR